MDRNEKNIDNKENLNNNQNEKNEFEDKINYIIKKIDNPPNQKTIQSISSVSPIEEIESSLMGFLNESIKTIKEVRDFNTEIREHIKARLPEASLIELSSILAQSQKYEEIQTATLITPINTALSSRQNISIGNEQKNLIQVSKDLHSNAPADVSQGLFILQQFIEIMGKIMDNNKNNKENESSNFPSNS